MGFETLPHNDAAALMNHLATNGPLSASVAASDWSSYHGGVFDGCDYNGNMVVNHAVTLIGYGTDPAEGDFWLVKNSWGTSWGEGGYISCADSRPHSAPLTPLPWTAAVVLME